MLAPLRFLSQYSTVNAKLNIETFPDPALRVNPHAPRRRARLPSTASLDASAPEKDLRSWRRAANIRNFLGAPIAQLDRASDYGSEG
jgi:hypothetical protein